jgi:selT/selW/selH-like putative selenoprotein
VKAELRGGSSGIFDVTADDAMIFSKHREGRYPETAEIVDALRRLGAAN